MKRTATAIAILFACVLALGALFVFSGQYDVAADEPHWAVTERLLGTVRDRSIARAAAAIEVPRLEDAAMVAKGAREYADMCAGCHLSPLSRDSITRQGLNPQPLDLYRHRIPPRRAFWVIKHGLKMTGMPAWGRSHDDASIWSIVAFLQKMPEMDAQGYRSLVAQAAPTERSQERGHH